MSDDDARLLEAFSAWLRRLGDDAEGFGSLVGVTALPDSARSWIAGGLNYLFKTLDLIPDGIDDIGYLDDAFVLRVAADQAIRDDVSTLAPEQLKVLNQLAEDADVVRGFLGDDYTRLQTYVSGLRKGSARGRAAADIVAADEVRDAFLSDVRAFARTYTAPGFSGDPKTLVKLRAFFDAKLPK